MATAALKRANTEMQDRTPRRRKLGGPEKAAILFLCLGEKRGSELMQQLDEEEIQKITRAMSRLGVIDSPQVVVDVRVLWAESLQIVIEMRKVNQIERGLLLFLDPFG